MVGKSLLLIFVCLSIAFTTANDDAKSEDEVFRREVTLVLNPQCPENLCKNFTLVHVESRGKQDVIHHLWTMDSVPTFFYAVTELNSQIIIDWNAVFANKSQSISFSIDPIYFAAVIISKFIMFNDLIDSGKLPVDDSQIVSFDTTEMFWKVKSVENSGNSSASIVFHLDSARTEILDPTTNIEIGLSTFGTRDRSSLLPHLLFTENSTQLDIVLDQFQVTSNFSNARLAVELVTLASESQSNFTMQVSKSLDDEYTPGVFKLMQVHSSLDEHFLQWRPVCYTSTTRNIGNSTGVDNTPLKNIDDLTILDRSLVSWISLNQSVKSMPIQGFNVSFGDDGDGFYKASNYTSWTMVTGHGRPVDDRFSLMVMLVMAVGLGVPTLVLILGGTGIAIRNYRQRKDDLLN